ncbi:MULTISPECIES: hypothetical protein [Streptomyces]|uniref:hypothetical protein n=1 Tax=Streptomyces TaxID=1883 RepID=UPI001E4681EA|nr:MULTISPECIES: hypothetical protein [Streptomyces]UFQ17746.1 hypothetical protein J2N69_23630 [Streptomyces huasconensis]WCL87352.1 hypothetical protein PPN52_23630 [Streptomyces sp. JCM 35825]
MSIRRSMTTRRAMTAVAITTGLVLTVVGCGGGDGGDDKPDEKSSPTSSGKRGESPAEQDQDGQGATDKVLAEVKGEENITLTVTSAVRDAGGFVTVSGKVTNNGGKFWAAANWRGEERELNKNGSSVAGANLIDNEGKKKYLVLRDTEGRCLCTKFTGGVKPSQTADWYAQFPAPPEDTTKVDFQVGAMPPAPIELSEGE